MKVGTCPVDSGQVMLVDPCYVLRDDRVESLISKEPREVDPPESKIGYDEMLKEWKYDTPSECVTHIPLKREKEGWPMGVVTSSGYGDGEYPVYLCINGEKRVVAALVVFDASSTNLDALDLDEEEEEDEQGDEDELDEQEELDDPDEEETDETHP